MREIKFRGKDVLNGEWIKGYLFYDYNNADEYRPFITYKSEAFLGGVNEQQIDENTIGQYTGLKDKNGKEIYEGDIVKKLIWNELKFEAEGDGQDYSYAKVQYIEELAGFHVVNKDNKILWEVAQDKHNIEVAGNIYDNPELLKGEENG